jgi:hypothetical protein
MQTTSLYHRLATAFAVTTAILAIGSPAAARAGTFPPLNSPMTVDSHSGKFVWAELFTTDAAAATKFYTGVFGWTAVTLNQHDVDYTVFSNGDHPVAGMRQRSSSALKRTSRWINYIAVTDIASALSTATTAGGVVRAPALDFPDIGSEAIITDNEGCPVGLLQSDSGDSADKEPSAGEWSWFHLHVKNPQAAADFYKQVFNYAVAQDARMAGKNELLLSSDGINRAGISPMPNREDFKRGWLGVIRVSSLDDTLARVPAFDGEVIVPPHAASFGSRFAVIADPSGGAVGLVEYLNNANPANHP